MVAPSVKNGNSQKKTKPPSRRISRSKKKYWRKGADIDGLDDTLAEIRTGLFFLFLLLLPI